MRKNVNRTVNNLSTKKNDAKHSKINRKELLIQNTKFILAIIAIIIAIIALVFGESKMIITQNKGNVPLTFNILNYQIITEGEQGEEPVIDYACTLAQAIQKAPTGSTIKVLADTTESTVANIPADKTITLNMNGKTIELTNSLSNYGTLTLTGEGEITSEEADTIVNYGTYAQQDAVKVSNTGTVLSGYSALVNSGEMTITGGEVEATNYAIKQLEEATLVVTRNTANNDEDVVGPNITSNKSVAIYAEKGTVTIGTNETPTTVINEENPVIKGKMHGIEAKAAATLNYYDGSIISESGKGTAIEYPETINKPTGKEIEKSITIETIENVETEIETTKLITPEYAENDKTTGNVVAYYETLDKALNSADNGNTIIPINATINDASTNNPTITSGKLLTLDLSGKNVILNKNIINEGTFTIKDSTSTTQNTTGTGKLESENNCITNEGSGNLTVTGGTILSTKSRTIIGNHKNTIINIRGGEIKGTAIIESNGSYNGDAVIATNGTFNMTGGKVRSESAFAVWITGNGTANVTGGIIEKDKNTSTGTDRWLGAACFQNSSTNKTTIAGTALIQNYNGSNSNVIYCEKSGIIEVGGNAIVQNLGSVIAGTNYSTGKIIVKDNAKITSAGGVVLRNNFNNGSSTSFGTIEIQGGEVSTIGTNAIENTCKYGVIKISGGKVTATGTTAIYNSGSGATVTVGTVGSTSSTTPVITGRIYGDTGVGLITVYSGKITATTSEAIYSKGNVIIGSKDNNTPLTSPIITGVTYGVQTSGTFNFYDGQITGPTNKSIYKNPDDTPIEAGYVVRIRNNGDSTETAYLDNNFSIILNPNGGTYNGTTSNSTVSATYNTEVNLGIPTRAGYTFKQWKTSDGIIYDKNILTGTEAPILNTSATNENTYWRSASDGGPRTIIDITNPPTEGITKGFEITGETSNGKIKILDVAQDSVPVTQGKTYTLSVWAKGSGLLNLQAGKTTFGNKTTQLNNVAQWTKYSWTFVAGQDGDVVNGLINIYLGNRGGSGTMQLCGMKLEENTGFSDLLWSKVPSTTSTPTLVAEWTANGYTLTINPNGGTYNSKTSNSTLSVTYDTEVNLGIPTRTGYTFKQWKTSDGQIYDKNILTGADAPEFKTPSTNENAGWRAASSGTGTRSVVNVSNSPVEGITKGFSIVGNGTITDVAQDTVPVTSGKTYTVSVWAKGTGSVYLQVGSSSWEGKNTVINNVTTWTKYSWTFIAGQNGNVVNGYTNIYFGNHGTGIVELCGMKLEEETGFADLLWSKVPSTTTAPTLVAEWTANTYTIKYNGNGNTGGSTASSTHTYDTSKALTTNGFTKTGYSFAGWSTSASDKNLIYDNNEYSVDNPSSSSSSNDFKQYSLSGPFESGEVYQLDVDVKGSGTMYNFFYGATNYRRVASWTSSTSGNSGTNSDGYNTVPLTSSYEHYTVTFTLGSSGSSSVEKRVLFRAAPGCTASIKNIRFTKISASSTAYMDGQSVKNLATTGTVNMYAMWAVDTLNNQSATSAGTTQMSASSKALASTSVKNKLSLGTKSVNLLDNNGETSNVNDTTENNNNELENVESLEQIKTETENAEITGNKEMHVIINATENTYSTFAEAIESANSGDTLKLLQDINLTEEVTIDKGKNIILDLNGKTISSTSASTINNNGTLTIKGTGIIKNETENGNVIYNTGILNIENVIITTAKNGGKCIYNDSEAEIENAKVIISNYDSIAIYNASNSKTCRINKTEITVEAEEIENYELIKNTNEFKETLNNLKQSYGIYNDSSTEVIIEDATIKIERLKGVGIFNKKDGTITLGKEDNNVSTATPIIYAISDNTTGIINNEKGKINFYDGRIITTSSIKNMITKVLFNHEIYEELNSNIINTTLRLIEIVQEENVESNVESKTESVEEKKKNEVLNKQDTQEEQPQVKEETTEKAEGNS